MKTKLIRIFLIAISRLGLFISYISAVLSGFAFIWLGIWLGTKTNDILSSSSREFLIFFSADVVMGIAVSFGLLYAVGALDRRISKRLGVDTLMLMPQF